MTKQLSHSPKTPRPFRHPAVRILVLLVGWLSVALGFIGIFLPVLPTTPFLLLAAACFVRTSPKFYQWLIDHPRLGKYLVY
ncbi:MAG: YbaN family protein, partial [Thalassolituus sp.]